MTATEESALRVEVYAQPGCEPCDATMRALDTAGVPYDEMPARDHRAFLLQLGARSTPVVITYRDGRYVRHWTGYSPDMIHALKEDVEEEPCKPSGTC